MKFWGNFAKFGEPGYSSNKIKWEPYNNDNDDLFSYMIIDNKRKLKMSSDNKSFSNLSEEIYSDDRLSELEKCVVLYQMFTYIGNDIYDEYMKEYPGKCNREASEKFIVNNAGVIDYE